MAELSMVIRAMPQLMVLKQLIGGKRRSGAEPFQGGYDGCRVKDNTKRVDRYGKLQVEQSTADVGDKTRSDGEDRRMMVDAHISGRND